MKLTSALPRDANVYGLGEVVASAGFRRDVAQNGTLQTLWARDAADPLDENMCVRARFLSSSGGVPMTAWV